jgi:hypothetical protein
LTPPIDGAGVAPYGPAPLELFPDRSKNGFRPKMRQGEKL